MASETHISPEDYRPNVWKYSKYTEEEYMKHIESKYRTVPENESIDAEPRRKLAESAHRDAMTRQTKAQWLLAELNKISALQGRAARMAMLDIDDGKRKPEEPIEGHDRVRIALNECCLVEVLVPQHSKYYQKTAASRAANKELDQVETEAWQILPAVPVGLRRAGVSQDLYGKVEGGTAGKRKGAKAGVGGPRKKASVKRSAAAPARKRSGKLMGRAKREIDSDDDSSDLSSLSEERFSWEDDLDEEDTEFLRLHRLRLKKTRERAGRMERQMLNADIGEKCDGSLLHKE